MKSYRLFMLFLAALFLLCAPAIGQEKEDDLGDFSDALEKTDDGDEDDGGWLGFIIELLWCSDTDDEAEANMLMADSGAAPEQGVSPMELLSPVQSFGSYPFSSDGFVRNDISGKQFMVRFSGSYQHVERGLNALRLQGDLQLNKRHGLRLDLAQYREDLRTRTDLLRIVSADYRYLAYADDTVLLSFLAGGRLILPDKERDNHIALNMGVGLQWFVAKPFSVDFMFEAAPILDEFRFDREDNPALYELEFGAGIHLQHVEIFGGYRALFPDSFSNTISGPQVGLRIWL